MPYVDAITVKNLACCKASDLGLDDTTFDTLITTLIGWATGEMDIYMGRHYTDVEIASDTIGKLSGGLSSVCFQAVDNYLLSTVQRKNAPIVTINEFVVRSPIRIILTKDMKETLEHLKGNNLPYPQYFQGTKRFDNSVTDIITKSDDAEDVV